MKSQKKESVGTPLPVVDKDHAMLTIPRAVIDRLLESAQVAQKSLEGIRNDLRPDLNHANTVLADLQKRVSILEQRQGRGETARVAKKGQAQSSRKGR